MSFLTRVFTFLFLLVLTTNASPHQVNARDSFFKAHIPSFSLGSRSDADPFPAGQLCPTYNASTFQTTSGSVFEINCGFDFAGGDLRMVYVANLTACTLACAGTKDCVAASLSGSACYLKSKLVSTASKSFSTVSTSSSTASGYVAGPQTQVPSCPSSNSTQYLAKGGAVFAIECFVDRYGNDLRMIYVSSFQACIDACSSTPGCVDVSLSGAACYMK
ncbi:hypothetical protein M436DRAFT_48973, partial [Aureobasidium namibiae CBS 147.97]